MTLQENFYQIEAFCKISQKCMKDDQVLIPIFYFFICWISLDLFPHTYKKSRQYRPSTSTCSIYAAFFSFVSLFLLFFPPLGLILHFLSPKFPQKTAKDTNPLKEEAQFTKSCTFLYMRQESYSAGLCQHSFNDIPIAYIQCCKIHQHTIYKKYSASHTFTINIK